MDDFAFKLRSERLDIVLVGVVEICCVVSLFLTDHNWTSFRGRFMAGGAVVSDDIDINRLGGVLDNCIA